MSKKNLIILTISIVVIIHIISFVFHERNGFYSDKAAEYITEHADSRSHNMCAWSVTLAMNAGGQPVPLLRGCDYEWYFSNFLDMQFTEVSKNQYIPQTGDVVVFRRIERHPYGHVAMWNGAQWVSDFKQNSIFPSRDYNKEDYTLFRPVNVIQP